MIMLKLENYINTLPNIANRCPHKSTKCKFYPFCESDKDLCKRIREDMTGGPSNVFTRKAVVEKHSSETHQMFGQDIPTTVHEMGV